MSISIRNNKTSALLSILFVVVIWGSASAITKLGLQEIPPFLFALLRNGVASFSLLLFYLSQRKTKTHQPSLPLPYKKIIWMGLTGITFFYILFNLSLVYTTASTGALIQGFIPVTIVLLAVIFLKERLEGVHIMGIILSVIGVILVGFIGSDARNDNSLLGNILMVLSVLSWAAYTVISKSLHEYNAVVLTVFSTIAGTLFLVPAVLIEQWEKPMPAISINAWAAILYLGIFSSTICYILYNKVLKILPAAAVGNFLNLDPVIGVIIAVIFLKDKITVWQVAGGLLVLIGIALSSKSSKQKNSQTIPDKSEL